MDPEKAKTVTEVLVAEKNFKVSTWDGYTARICFRDKVCGKVEIPGSIETLSDEDAVAILKARVQEGVDAAIHEPILK